MSVSRLDILRPYLENIDRWELEESAADYFYPEEEDANLDWWPENYRSLPMSDNQIAKAIHDARQHVLHISKRDHLKADRYERVGLFITSLRTKVSLYGIDRGCREIFERKLWYDAGILDPSATFYPLKLELWVRLARNMEFTIDSMSEAIDADIEEMKKEVAACSMTIREAERINGDADKLVSAFIEVLEDKEC